MQSGSLHNLDADVIGDTSAPGWKLRDAKQLAPLVAVFGLILLLLVLALVMLTGASDGDDTEDAANGGVETEDLRASLSFFGGLSGDDASVIPQVTATATATASPTPTAVAPATPQPTATMISEVPIPTLVPTATATVTPEPATAIPATATAVPATATAIPATATAVPATATAIPATPVPTAIPATPVPTAIPATPVPTAIPATATPVPPAPTSTPVPTAIPAPPTATAAPTPIPAPPTNTPLPGGFVDTTPQFDGTIEANFVNAINQYRAGLGLSALIHDPALTNAARNWSSNGLCCGTAFGQIPPHNSSLTVPGARSTGENVGWGNDTWESLHNALLASPGHEANIASRSRAFTHVGVGVVASGRNIYVTQVFALY